MKSLLSQIAVCVMLIFAFHAHALAAKVPAEGAVKHYQAYSVSKKAPSLQFQTENGQKIGLNHFTGKVVLLNVWATWCPACRAEMPALNALQKKYDKTQFEVVAVSVDRQGSARVAPYFSAHGIDQLTMYFDPVAYTMDRLGINAIPKSYIIDARGNLRGALDGEADWNSQEARALIDYYINEAKPDPFANS